MGRLGSLEERADSVSAISALVHPLLASLVILILFGLFRTIPIAPNPLFSVFGFVRLLSSFVRSTSCPSHPDFAHEPVLHQAAEILRDPKTGPVLYWQLRNEGTIIDGSSYQATEWRTIPDYQGGEWFLASGKSSADYCFHH